jgi:hypothetical protein
MKRKSGNNTSKQKTTAARVTATRPNKQQNVSDIMYGDENVEGWNRERQRKGRDNARKEDENDDADDDESYEGTEYGEDEEEEEGRYEQERTYGRRLSYGQSQSSVRHTASKRAMTVGIANEDERQGQTPNEQGVQGPVRNVVFNYTPELSSTTETSRDRENYEKHLQMVGYQQTEHSVNNNVKKYVGNILYKRLKFIVSEEEMESGGVIANTVADHFHIRAEDRVRWWGEQKRIVHAEIRLKRNNAGVQLRTAFRSK